MFSGNAAEIFYLETLWYHNLLHWTFQSVQYSLEHYYYQVSMRQLDFSSDVPAYRAGRSFFRRWCVRVRRVRTWDQHGRQKEDVCLSETLNNTFTAVSCMSVRRKSKGNSRTSSHQPLGTRAASFYALSFRLERTIT